MWSFFWTFLKAFVVGGLLCAIGELLILKTRLTSARILVGYVTAGAILLAVLILFVYKDEELGFLSLKKKHE